MEVNATKYFLAVHGHCPVWLIVCGHMFAGHSEGLVGAQDAWCCRVYELYPHL